MIPLFALPVVQLRAEHVEQLRAEELPEGQTVEYKQTLPNRRGGADAWLTAVLQAFPDMTASDALAQVNRLRR